MGAAKTVFKVVLGFAVACVMLVGIASVVHDADDAADKHDKAAVQRIEDDVAKDAVAQYGIAKRNGTKMDACMQAGLVAEMYLQAKNENEYARWKKIEGVDCAAAGMPK